MAAKKKTGKKTVTAYMILGPLHVGNKVFIRAVTYHYLGRVVGLTDTEILLDQASWVADSGIFSVACKTGTLSEVEPYPDGVISVARGAVVDVSTWQHALPRERK